MQKDENLIRIFDFYRPHEDFADIIEVNISKKYVKSKYMRSGRDGEMQSVVPNMRFIHATHEIRKFLRNAEHNPGNEQHVLRCQIRIVEDRKDGIHAPSVLKKEHVPARDGFDLMLEVFRLRRMEMANQYAASRKVKEGSGKATSTIAAILSRDPLKALRERGDTVPDNDEAVAKLAKSMGMNVIYKKAKPDTQVDYRDFCTQTLDAVELEGDARKKAINAIETRWSVETQNEYIARMREEGKIE